MSKLMFMTLLFSLICKLPGKSQNAVDTNMSVLIRRMENLRMKERLNTYHYKMEKNGWNYTSKYDVVHKHKMHNFLVTSFQLAHIVCTTIALVFLTGSLLIFLVSFIFSQSIN